MCQCYLTQMVGGSVEYEPNKGTFTWRDVTSNRIKEGSPAGCLRLDGYLTIAGIRAHRLAFKAMGVELNSSDIVDHIDGDVSNNSWSNLRLADKKVNAHNTTIRATNKTGIRGVSFNKSRNRYRTALLVDGKQVSKRFK